MRGYFTICLLVIAAIIAVVHAGTSPSKVSIPIRRGQPLTKAVRKGKKYAWPRGYLGNGNDIPYHDYENVQFFGPVALGTPNQKFEVVYDTGSSNVWVPGWDCPLSSCFLKERYISAESSTYQPNGTKFSIMYGSGPVSGFFSTDQMTVGDLSCPAQSFAQVTNASGLGPAFLIGQFDGIAGLAFDSISVDRATPFMDNLVAANPGLKNEFAFYLPPHQDIKGELDIGGDNPSHYTGTLKVIPLTNETYFEARLDGVAIGNHKLAGTARFVADSGTSTLTMPTKYVTELAQRIGATQLLPGRYLVDCSTISSLPPLKYNLNGHIFEIPAEDYVINDENIECILGVMGIDLPKRLGEIFIFGDVGLRRVYTVFSKETRSLKMAYVKM